VKLIGKREWEVPSFGFFALQEGDAEADELLAEGTGGVGATSGRITRQVRKNRCGLELE